MLFCSIIMKKVPSWERQLIADVTSSWKQRRCRSFEKGVCCSFLVFTLYFTDFRELFFVQSPAKITPLFLMFFNENDNNNDIKTIFPFNITNHIAIAISVQIITITYFSKIMLCFLLLKHSMRELRSWVGSVNNGGWECLMLTYEANKCFICVCTGPVITWMLTF